MRYRLVHLDLDGTLCDTRADLAASTNRVRVAYGLEPLAPEGVFALVGRGARVLVERALGPERRVDHDAAVELFLEHYAEHCLDHTLAYDGMEPWIDECRAEGVRFSVVTNKPEALARTILDGLELSPKLVALVGGDTFPERKPDPQGVLHVQALVGVSLAESLYVGDSAVDAQTAANAGLDCCGVLWGLDPEGLRAERPAHLVDTPAGLSEIVRGG